LIGWIRNGGRSQCAVNHQTEQTPVLELLNKVSRDLETMRSEIESFRSELQALKQYTVSEDHSLQGKVDAMELQLRNINERLAL